MDVFRAERLGGDEDDQCRINSARKPQHHLADPYFTNFVADKADQEFSQQFRVGEQS